MTASRSAFETTPSGREPRGGGGEDESDSAPPRAIGTDGGDGGSDEASECAPPDDCRIRSMGSSGLRARRTIFPIAAARSHPRSQSKSWHPPSVLLCCSEWLYLV